MNEDDVYRSSTQFRFWTYTSKALDDLRAGSNSLAASRVRDAIKRSRENGVKTETATNSTAIEVDCLSVEEEQKLVGWYCVKAMEFCDFSEFPKAVKATAVQFLKRFYLSTSPMTYHPKQMMLSAIYLATKVENFYIGIAEFAKMIPKTTPDDILAPEFLLTQGLRFTFDVRHPYRGLEGGIMELHEMSKGGYTPPHGSSLTMEDVRRGILKIKGQGGKSAITTQEEFAERIKRAHNKAGDILTKGALLTDAYFLYTPSQIWMSALLAADKPLTEFYLHVILSGTANSSVSEPSALELRLLSLLEQCAGLMTRSSSRGPDETETAELKRIDKKLYQCRNPEKIDLVGMNRAAKEGLNGDNGDDEKIIKKRKIERDRAAKEEQDLFGAPLKK